MSDNHYTVYVITRKIWWWVFSCHVNGPTVKICRHRWATLKTEIEMSQNRYFFITIYRRHWRFILESIVCSRFQMSLEPHKVARHVFVETNIAITRNSITWFINTFVENIKTWGRTAEGFYLVLVFTDFFGGFPARPKHINAWPWKWLSILTMMQTFAYGRHSLLMGVYWLEQHLWSAAYGCMSLLRNTGGDGFLSQRVGAESCMTCSTGWKYIDRWSQFT